MAWSQISSDFIQYQADASGTSASGYYLKCYAAGTTTPINVSLDDSGSTLVAKVELDSEGFAQNASGGSTAVYVDQAYRIVLYANATDADTNTFASALQDVDDIPQPTSGENAKTDIKASGEYIKNFATLVAAVNDTDLVDGDTVNLVERVSGNDGGGVWDVVLSSTVTENTYDIVQCVGVPTLSLVLRVLEEFNVKQFGALIDGSTDDSGAFDAARDRSPNNSVLVPAGTAVVTTGTFTDSLFHSHGDFSSDNTTLHVGKVTKTLDEDITVTVGSGGDFATINAAIEFLSKMRPSAQSTPVEAEISLLTGFTMAEQVLVSGVDLSWIRITGVDAETTITSASITASITDGADNYSSELYPAFGVTHGGSLPKIQQMFDMGFTAQDPAQKNVGVLAFGPGSTAEVGRNCGVRRCGWYGAIANYGATIYAYESDFNTSYGRGMFANESSIISAREADVSNAASTGFHSSDASIIAAENATATGCQIGLSANNAGIINGKGVTCTGCQEGVFAQNGSTIHAENVNASGATGGNGVGIRALGNGRINAKDANASGADNFGVSAEKGSWINADGVNAQVGGSPASSDCRVLTGSTVNFSGGTGGTSVTVNTLSAAGIIYQ